MIVNDITPVTRFLDFISYLWLQVRQRNGRL